jgi:hypothetical protein
LTPGTRRNSGQMRLARLLGGRSFSATDFEGLMMRLTSTPTALRRPGGGGGRGGRLRAAALVGGGCAVRFLCSASLRAGAVGRLRASSSSVGAARRGWGGGAGGRRPGGWAVGVGGSARLPSSAAGMRSVSSARLRCVWTLWAVSGNPSGIPGSTMGLATGTSARLRAGQVTIRASPSRPVPCYP